MLFWLRPEAPARVLALEPLPASNIDLRDQQARLHLSWLVRYARAQGRQPEDSLFYDCAERRPDTYALLWSRYSLGKDSFSYLEIERRHDEGATAQYWQSAVPSALNHVAGPASGQKAPLQPRSSQVSTEDFATLEAAFLALAHDRVTAMRGYLSMVGDTVQLEYCRNGEYGFFIRTQYFEEPDGQHIVALAQQMLVAAGLPKVANAP